MFNKVFTEKLGNPKSEVEPQPELSVTTFGEDYAFDQDMNDRIGSAVQFDYKNSAPDFLNDLKACQKAFDQLGQVAYLLPTLDALWVAVIAYNDGVAVSVSLEKKTHALAAGLFFLINSDKLVVT